MKYLLHYYAYIYNFEFIVEENLFLHLALLLFKFCICGCEDIEYSLRDLPNQAIHYGVIRYRESSKSPTAAADLLYGCGQDARSTYTSGGRPSQPAIKQARS